MRVKVVSYIDPILLALFLIARRDVFKFMLNIMLLTGLAHILFFSSFRNISYLRRKLLKAESYNNRFFEIISVPISPIKRKRSIIFQNYRSSFLCAQPFLRQRAESVQRSAIL